MTFLNEYSIILPIFAGGAAVNTYDVVNYIMIESSVDNVMITSGFGTWRGYIAAETEDVRIYTFAADIDLVRAKHLAAVLGERYRQCKMYLRTPQGVLFVASHTEDSTN